MKHFNLFLAAGLALAGSLLPAAEPAKSMPFDNGGAHLMNVCLNGTMFMPADSRYCTRDFQNGATGKRLKIYPNKDFREYDAKEGAVVTQDGRFWLIGGSGTINNKRWQPTDVILTGIVRGDGTLEGMKKVRSLPFPAKYCRAAMHGNRIYVLGGNNRSDLVSAEILKDGELGEWKTLPSYPTAVAQGGLVCWHGVLYANGRSTWRPGSGKMYALKLREDGSAAGKWERVDSPDNAQGYLKVHNNALYYFDEISGRIYKTVQEDDGIQLKEWEVAGNMPCPPKTGGVSVVDVPGGWLFCGGFLPRGKDNKFAGFLKPFFLPFSALK